MLFSNAVAKKEFRDSSDKKLMKIPQPPFYKRGVKGYSSFAVRRGAWEITLSFVAQSTRDPPWEYRYPL
jgi:hypothetical protein